MYITIVINIGFGDLLFFKVPLYEQKKLRCCCSVSGFVIFTIKNSKSFMFAEGIVCFNRESFLG